jgi:DNA-binding response OmpR family regulator
MILVVDDDTKMAETLKRTLERRGYSVRCASDGGEAYRLIKTQECECMLLDINMPRINGVELLLLMQSENIQVPTIIMAGFDDYEEQEMHLFNSVTHFFRKPFGVNELMTAINRSLAHCTAPA